MEKVRKLSTPKTSRNQFSVSQSGGPSAINRKPIKILGSNFLLDSRYEVRDTVGSGAYGVVVSARDTVSGELVAIKKIEKAFEHSTFTKRTLRELIILRLLEHENVIRIKTIQLPLCRDEFDEIYVVSELMETDLSSIIKSPQILSDEHCQFFLYQILRGIKYIHSAHILHRDLKPRNLLVNSNCDLKVCDFGLARPFIDDLKIRGSQMTDYVATRWYRAPEVLLTYRKYTAAIDMWSIGCIFAELLLRKPLLPGNDSNNQLDLIFDMIGTPSDEDIASIPHLRARDKVSRMPKRNKKAFETIFSECNPDAIDLVRKFLVFNPDKRITIDEALEHPYLSTLHCPDDEPTRSAVSGFDFEFEKRVLNIRELKDLIYEEILLYHFPQKREEYDRAKLEYSLKIRVPLRETSSNGPNEDSVGEEDEY
ncbi:unnamed protein product [Blepharisma stoltei]|uniref:Mitogen-activated protein kinase n=1 Tax=Blepharisma stoltei TaxID=1481888 RepID=A0AAU9JBT5_9CILI|nr:unnamed protein product [Blepharisma stoltei]